MSKLQSTKEYYDDFSGSYEDERHHGYHAMLDELELEVLRPHAENREVLEVGAGTGLILKGLEGIASRLVGVDLSPGMLKKASRRGFEVVQGSATELPFADEHFDLVYSFKVLAHVPDIEQALGEMARVLRPGGSLVAEFYNKKSLRNLAKRLAGPGRISASRDEADVFTRWDSTDDVLSYLPSAVALEHWRGIRVLTPAAMVFRLPGAERVMLALERRAMSSPFSMYGGFLVAVCRKL